MCAFIRQILRVLDLAVVEKFVRLGGKGFGAFFDAVDVCADVGGLEDAGDDGDEDDEGGEGVVVEVGPLVGLGACGVAGVVVRVAGVPSLPVFPGCVGEGAVGVGGGVGVLGGGVVGCLAAPAGSREVVGAPFGWVGEDGVRLHDEAVAFEAFGAGEGVDGLVGGGAGVAVGVVDFDEFVEFVFGVDGGFVEVEDVVGGGLGRGGSGILAAWPIHVVAEVVRLGGVFHSGVGAGLGGRYGSRSASLAIGLGGGGGGGGGSGSWDWED